MMNIRRAPTLFYPSPNSIDLSQNGLLLFTIENIERFLQEKNILLSNQSRQELIILLKENCQFVKFSNFILTLHSLTSDDISGAGLTDSEKIHHNQLLNEMKTYQILSSDTPSEMEFKINEISLRQLQVNKYRNIIKLNQAYWEILSDDKTWEPEYNEIKQEWDFHKRFAKYDSSEVLSLYNAYVQGLTLTNTFITLVREYKSGISIECKNILLAYAAKLRKQIEDARHHALLCLIHRLNLAEKYQDLHFDDVIYHTVFLLEKRLQRRIIVEQKNKQDIFDQLRKRRRKGLTINVICEVVSNLQSTLIQYKKNDLYALKYSTLYSITQHLGFIKLPNQNKKIIAEDGEHDPIILYLLNNMDKMEGVVKDRFPFFLEESLAIINDLDELIDNAHTRFLAIQTKGWFYKNQKLKDALEDCRKKYFDLLQYAYYFLIDQLNVRGEHLIKQILSSDSSVMAVYQDIKQLLNKFTCRYSVHLSKMIDLKKKDLLLEVVIAINEDPSIIHALEIRRRFAVMLAKNYHWPISTRNSSQYESTVKYLEIKLDGLLTYHRNEIYYSSTYISHNETLFYLEQTFPNDVAEKYIRHKALARYCHYTWKNVFELAEIKLDNGNIVIAPQLLLNEISDVSTHHFRSTRVQFLSENKSLLIQLNEVSSYFENVVLPYVRYSRFISLINISTNRSYFEDLNYLLSLYDQLVKKVQVASTSWTLTSNAKKFFRNLIKICNDNKEQMASDWRKALYENLYASMRTKDICLYLGGGGQLIDKRKLDGLIDKVKTVFVDNKCYQQLLLVNLQEACTDTLKSNLFAAFSDVTDVPQLQQFIYCIMQFRQMKDFGHNVITNIFDDKKITYLIENHLSHFDGSKNEIGSFIVALHTANIISEKDVVNRYVIPYAIKRLAYIWHQSGSCIQHGDIVFFEEFSSVRNCKELFDCYQSKIPIKHLVTDSSLWDEQTAKLIELFGDYKSRSLYRYKCIVPLLMHDSSDQKDLAMLDQFETSIFHPYEDLIDPKLIVSHAEKTFEAFVELYINAPIWNEARDRVLGLLDDQQQKRAHMWYLYQLLNNQAVDFGPWLEKKLKYSTPEELFGEENIEYITQHVVGLIKVAHIASREINLEANQFEMLSSVMANLKYMRSFFEKLGNHVAYVILEDIEILQNNLRLANLCRKLLLLLPTLEESNSYSDKTFYNILTQLIQVFSEIEKIELINFNNIKEYLCFINNVILRLHGADFHSTSEKYLVGYFNFCLIIIDHFKKVVMQFIGQSYVSDEEVNFIKLLINYIDDNERIDQKRYLISIALESNDFLRDTFDYLFDLSRIVNQVGKKASDKFIANLNNLSLAHGGVDSSALAFSSSCLSKILSYSKVLRLTPAFFSYMMKQVEDKLKHIPLLQMEKFRKLCHPHISQLNKIAYDIAGAEYNNFSRLSLFSKNAVTVQSMMETFADTYQKQMMCYDICMKLVAYINSKLTIKVASPFSLFKNIFGRMGELAPKDQLEFVIKTLGVKRVKEGQQVMLALEFFNDVEGVYTDRMKKSELLIKVTDAFHLVEKKDKATLQNHHQIDFSMLLKSMIDLMKKNVNIENLNPQPIPEMASLEMK